MWKPLNDLDRFISSIQNPDIVKNPGRPSLKDALTRKDLLDWEKIDKEIYF